VVKIKITDVKGEVKMCKDNDEWDYVPIGAPFHSDD